MGPVRSPKVKASPPPQHPGAAVRGYLCGAREGSTDRLFLPWVCHSAAVCLKVIVGIQWMCRDFLK